VTETLSSFRGSELAPLAEKVFSGERLSFDDGVRLFQTRDFLGLGRLANHVREKLHGNVAYYNVNRYLNPTNLCWVDCALCAWAKKVNEPGGYEMAIDECVEEAGKGYSEAVTEFHIVGGLHPTWPFEYYTGLMRALKERFPGVHLKAWTMVEVDWIAHVGKRELAQAIRELKDAGMDSCPGGGAEIFAKRVRDIICTNKISGERWLEVARECHRAGVKTNATMLYGHVETVEERVDHLLRLRELQDETGGIPGLIPLAFHPENTPLAHLPPSTGQLDLRVIAVSRLLLDNVPHSEGVLDPDRHQARADRAVVRRRRPGRNGRGRDHHARRRRDDGERHDALRLRAHHPRVRSRAVRARLRVPPRGAAGASLLPLPLPVPA
jgi:aminodeoxyfutalosine synthase